VQTYTSVNKAYRAIQGTSEEAFAVVEAAVNDTPVLNGWRATMYYAIVVYHPEKVTTVA